MARHGGHDVMDDESVKGFRGFLLKKIVDSGLSQLYDPLSEKQ